MEKVVVELERIREKEMALTTVMGEGTATFTKGSELFTSKWNQKLLLVCTEFGPSLS